MLLLDQLFSVVSLTSNDAAISVVLENPGASTPKDQLTETVEANCSERDFEFVTVADSVVVVSWLNDGRYSTSGSQFFNF